MRHFLISLSMLLVLILAGCSSSGNNPTQPASNPDLPLEDLSYDGVALCYQGTFDIDLETQTINQIENRQSDFVYDITGFLPDKCPGGCFRFTIVGVVGTVLEIELTLENPLAIQVYDARVQYLDLFGKTVINPDSYTDFLGTPISNVFPFTAFVKEDDNRAFPVGPGGIDTETMYLDFPPGSASSVNYAITVNLPGQTLEPYEISGMAQFGDITPTGGSAIISCVVDDHQDDISGVYMDATPFTGAPVQLVFNDPVWEAEISNTSGAPEGIYNQLIMALSPNGQNISTYNYVEITVSEQSGNCPDAPYAGGTFTTTLSYLEYLIVGGSSDYDWYIKSDVFFDMDILSNGEVVSVYSNDGTEPSVNLYNGSLRRADTTVARTYTIVDGDYPGFRATQIDVDSTDMVIIVTSDIPHNTETTIPVGQRNSQAHDYFRVVDPFIGSASELIVNVGTPIAAVDIDANDDVWVLGINNVMHKYDKSSGYAEVVSASFDLDVTTDGMFTNDVYDFVIDFYNEAFFILVENDDATKVDLWRIECDGEYLMDINGNTNPFMDVLGPLMQPITNSADIAIDNLDSYGAILSGEQDSQIVVTGNYLHTPDLGGYGMVARIDSELYQHEEYLASLGFGISCFCFDQVQNIGWAWGGETFSDIWLHYWTVPSGWN